MMEELDEPCVLARAKFKCVLFYLAHYSLRVMF